MTTRYEGAGATDVKLTIHKAGEEIGDDVVPEGQIALAFNYDEVFYIQGTPMEVMNLLTKAERALESVIQTERVRPPAVQEDQPTYTAVTEWGDFLAGKPNVYTYTFSDGRVFRQEEMKNIATGGWTQKVALTDGGKWKRSTLKELRAATKAAKEEL